MIPITFWCCTRLLQYHPFVLESLESLFQIKMSDVEDLFTKAQKAQIILQYGKLGSATRVRRWFRKEYKTIPNSKIPKVGRFLGSLKSSRRQQPVKMPRGRSLVGL